MITSTVTSSGTNSTSDTKSPSPAPSPKRRVVAVDGGKVVYADETPAQRFERLQRIAKAPTRPVLQSK